MHKHSRHALWGLLQAVIVQVKSKGGHDAAKVLGDLRQALSIEAQKHVKGEIAKDLTNHRIGEIETILGRFATA